MNPCRILQIEINKVEENDEPNKENARRTLITAAKKDSHDVNNITSKDSQAIIDRNKLQDK